MSGKPYPDGVEKFRSAVARAARARQRVDVLVGEINHRNTELTNQRIEQVAAENEIFKLMEEMDVLSSGNAGYESRAAWFFAELHKQFINTPR